jgi:hypothetical protein
MREVKAAASSVGPAVGALLFAAGLMQARRLATWDIQAARQAARTSGSTRVAVGGVFAARPQLFARLLHGCPSPDPTTRLQIRIFAVREIALGLGALTAAVANRDVRRWLLVLSLVDTGEALVLPLALRRNTVPHRTGIAFVAADLGSSASGVGVLTQIVRDRRRSMPATRTDAR